jgi:hypothetical protein
MADLQTLIDQWSQTKDLTKPVTLKIYGNKITGKESITYDSANCKNTKKTLKKAKSISLPIPDKCPNPL